MVRSGAAAPQRRRDGLRAALAAGSVDNPSDPRGHPMIRRFLATNAVALAAAGMILAGASGATAAAAPAGAAQADENTGNVRFRAR
jgi:hypothetical protein